MPWIFYNANGQRLSTASTLIDNLDIDGATDIGAAIVDADLFIIDDGAGGTNRKTAASRIKTYVEDAAGEVPIANLDIDGGTDIGAAIVDADLFIIDDGAGGTNRKTAASRLKTYVANSSKVVQGTRAASAGDSTQEVDTAGFAPVAAIILAIEDGTQAVAIGMVDSSDNRASIYGQTQGSYPNIWNEHATGFQVRDGSDYSNGVMTLTSDGVDIVWTLNNSGVDVTWKILFFS